MIHYHLIKLSQTCCYLLKLTEGYLLIDCGRASDQQTFLDKIHKLEISLSDISYLFLTHHHNDHCGLLSFLTTQNPEIRIVMSRSCAEYLKTGHHFKAEQEHYANSHLRLFFTLYVRFNQQMTELFTPYFPRPVDLLLSEETTTLPPGLGLNGKFIATPGHTSDSFSYVLDKFAFVGDAARNLLNFTGTPYHPILLHNLDTVYRSWNKLLLEGVDTICPAHGQPFTARKLKIPR